MWDGKLHPQIQLGKWDGRGTQEEGGVSGSRRGVGAQQVLQRGKGSVWGEFATLLVSKVSALIILMPKVVSGQEWKDNSAGESLMSVLVLCKIPGIAAFLGWQWRQIQPDWAARDLGRSLC